ncbi:Ribonuclease H [Parasponia andersonii]|uniref:Ribonuclease H n=1 Tax=Parasponia andersonii TaxID=3476 RepID=A0A2P5CUK8_PARAD|nr:Ribonuclease H [Parasponia andersonii]
MADFLVEIISFGERHDLNHMSQLHPPSTWTLYTDGSTNASGSGIGIVLQTPMGLRVEKALRLGFQATNNEAEYEALLQGLELALHFGVEDIAVKTDSQLIAGQVRGDFEVKEPRLHRYFSKVMGAKACFANFNIEPIPREKNQRADGLAKNASIGGTTESIEVLLDGGSMADTRRPLRTTCS